MSKVQPLLVRTPLFPDESLESFLFRLTQLNTYDSLNILQHLALADPFSKRRNIQKRYIRDILHAPLKTETYARIASLTLIDPFALYRSTRHRFALVLTPPPQAVSYLTLPDKTFVPCFSNHFQSHPQMRPLDASQFCPKCLQEIPYYRLNWMLVPVSSCLDHKCLLVDRCPNCHKKVSHHSIAITRCDYCKGDLTSAKLVSIADDEIGLYSQQILQSLFMQYVTPDNDVFKLPLQSPTILFRIINGLQNSLEVGKSGQWLYLHSLPSHPNGVTLYSRKEGQLLTPYESYCIYSTACRAIMNWPVNFFQFLLNYCKKSDADFQHMRYEPFRKNIRLASSILDNFGALYTQWIKDRWSYPEFEFVQEAFDYHIANNYQINNLLVRTYPSPAKPTSTNPVNLKPSHVEPSSSISIATAISLLNTTPEVFELLQRNEILTLVLNDEQKFYNRNEILLYGKSWASLIGQEKAGLLVGVPPRVIKELAEFGLIIKYPDSRRDPNRYYNTLNVMAFLEKLSSKVRSCSSQELAEIGLFINFSKVDYIFTYKETLHAITILLQILRGDLKAYHPMEGKFQLKNLLFTTYDFQKSIERLRNHSLWLERKEVIKILGIKDTTLASWIRNGRILPIAMYQYGKYFLSGEVHALCSMYITQKEAALILRISLSTFQNWIDANQIQELLIDDPQTENENAHVFNKEQLIQWRAGRFTSEETIQALGVSKPKLYKWIKEEKIKPLEIMSGNQYWFLKQTVLELKETI